jgi:hypothetical protein
MARVVRPKVTEEWVEQDGDEVFESDVDTCEMEDETDKDDDTAEQPARPRARRHR